MTIAFNGVEHPLLPRVKRMVKLLVLNQREIETMEFGQLTFDFSTTRAVLYLTKKKLGEEKVERE